VLAEPKEAQLDDRLDEVPAAEVFDGGLLACRRSTRQLVRVMRNSYIWA